MPPKHKQVTIAFTPAAVTAATVTAAATATAAASTAPAPLLNLLDPLPLLLQLLLNLRPI